MGSYLGQNFLKDTKTKQYIKDKITKIYSQGDFDTIVEIGPGKGAITRHLINIPKKYIMIEKDETMLSNLQGTIDNLQQKNQESEISNQQPTIIHEDILKVDISKLLSEHDIQPNKCLVIGNLPYYITSPILTKFFGTGMQEFQAGFFMIQKEVGDKIQTDAKKKSYLRWVLNYGYEVTYLKNVAPKCFSPAPKVTSCLIQFQPKSKIPNFTFSYLKAFLDQYAPFSRKTLGKNQKITEKNSCIKEDEFLIEIPEHLKSKRLEELARKELEEIIS